MTLRRMSTHLEVLLEVGEGDGRVLAALLQLDVGVAGQGEVQVQVLHAAAIHRQALQGQATALLRLKTYTIQSSRIEYNLFNNHGS